jgi:L-threonylcarbamoyladenylate synthase
LGLNNLKTEILSIQNPDAILRAISILNSGGLVAIPTDTVYGLAAMVKDASAIARIYQAKERNENKAIAVLIGDLSQLDQVADGLNQAARRLAQAFWPGALTLVVARRADLPENLSPLPTIGVRMPDHAFARQLLRQAGPLATTSANLSGGPNPRNAQEVLAQLEGRIELVLNGGDAPGGIPSTVVDCTGSAIAILRAGAISPEQIETIVNKST